MNLKLNKQLSHGFEFFSKLIITTKEICFKKERTVLRPYKIINLETNIICFYIILLKTRKWKI